MCGVTFEEITSTSAYAVLATFLPRLEVLAYHLGRNRLCCGAYKALTEFEVLCRIKIDGQMFILFLGNQGARNGEIH